MTTEVHNGPEVGADRHALIAPASVALVGASGRPGHVTARPIQFLRKHGYKGEVFIINPGHERILDTPTHDRVSAIGRPVEHAYIMVNTARVFDAALDCIDAGVKVLTVLADGFAEGGIDGQRRQQRLVALCDEARVRLIGPNSMGVVNTRGGFVCTTNAAFATPRLGCGRTAVISQSGSLIGTVLSRGQARGLNFASLVSVGNEAQLGVGEVGSLLVDDPGIDAFVLFLETLRRVEAIEEFAAAAARLRKPVVAYRTGNTNEGQALSVSHTGALVGSRAAVNGFLKHVGIIAVDQFESLLEAPMGLNAVSTARPTARGVTVVSTTGGGGAMVVDRLSLRGVPIIAPSRAIADRLVELGLPRPSGNLIDVTLAGARAEVLSVVLDELVNDPNTGIVVVAIGSSAQFNPDVAVRPIIDAARAQTYATTRSPIVAFPVPEAMQSLQLLAEHAIPAFRTVESCAETVALMLDHKRVSFDRARGPTSLGKKTRALIDEIKRPLSDEFEASTIFASIGIAPPAQLRLDPDAPMPASLPFDYPCVVKLLSPDIPHKTEYGTVRVGVRNASDLALTVKEMRLAVAKMQPTPTITGVLVQAMESGIMELVVGATRDPVVGPVVTVGMGGKLAEIYNDTTTRPAPVDQSIALTMLSELRVYPALCGYRGDSPADLDAAANAIEQLSRLMLSERVVEAEINPLLVRIDGEGAVLLDALIRVADTDAANDCDYPSQ